MVAAEDSTCPATVRKFLQYFDALRPDMSCTVTVSLDAPALLFKPSYRIVNASCCPAIERLPPQLKSSLYHSGTPSFRLALPAGLSFCSFLTRLHLIRPQFEISGHEASDPPPSSTHSHLAISITMRGTVQASVGQSCSALQVNISTVRMYIARENQSLQ